MNTINTKTITPKDTLAEQTVLGSFLVFPNETKDLIHTLSPDDFYSPVHQKILITIQKLSEQNIPPDIITVGNALEQQKMLDSIGGRSYLTQIATTVTSLANLPHYIHILKKLRAHRDFQKASLTIYDLAFTKPQNDIIETISIAKTELDRVLANAHITPDTIRHAADVAEHSYARIASMWQSGHIGLSTTFRDLDKAIWGIRAGSFVEIASRPSVGKSLFAITMAWRLASSGIPAGYITLEMEPEDLIDRLIQASCRMNYKRFLNPSQEEKEKITKALNTFLNSPLYIAKPHEYTTSRVCSLIRDMVIQKGCRIVFIDHSQCIIDPGYDNRTEEMYAKSLLRLSALRAELKTDAFTPIIVLLVQINREAEKNRHDRRPQLHHLRDTGQHEIVSDLILGLHRPEMYPDCPDDEKHILEVIVLKNRNGPARMKVRLTYLEDIQLIENYTRDQPEYYDHL